MINDLCFSSLYVSTQDNNSWTRVWLEEPRSHDAHRGQECMVHYCWCQRITSSEEYGFTMKRCQGCKDSSNHLSFSCFSPFGLFPLESTYISSWTIFLLECWTWLRIVWGFCILRLIVWYVCCKYFFLLCPFFLT